MPGTLRFKRWPHLAEAVLLAAELPQRGEVARVPAVQVDALPLPGAVGVVGALFQVPAAIQWFVEPGAIR